MPGRNFGVIAADGAVLYKGSHRHCRNYITWIENKGGQPGALSIRLLDKKEAG